MCLCTLGNNPQKICDAGEQGSNSRMISWIKEKKQDLQNKWKAQTYIKGQTKTVEELGRWTQTEADVVM